MRQTWGGWLIAPCLLAAFAVRCGAGGSRSLVVELRTDETIAGRFLAVERVLEFSATKSDAFRGDVVLSVGSRAYDFHYDYVLGQVFSDGHGKGLDRPTSRLLLDAIERVRDYLGANNPELAFHEQMLYAALVTWQESGGMPLDPTTFVLAPTETNKSLGNDGVTCIESGVTYPASFTYGDTTVIDRSVTAGESSCNGLCGPSCAQLQPSKMWTLDCLEHDECCRETGDSLCWTPLGECGDEYGVAETDFLRGFYPFRPHCGG